MKRQAMQQASLLDMPAPRNMEKKMSRLEELIAELCPDGVEYKKVGDICLLLDNERRPVTKKDRVCGVYPYYGANGIQDYVDSYIFDGTFLLIGEDGSVINTDGSPVLHYVTGKIWVNNHAHVLCEKKGILLRYVYYSLSIINISSIVRGTPPKLNQKNLTNIRIPVPPLPVQEEIVRILDTFTELTSELTSELTKRKQQYQYYRDNLIKTATGNEWKTFDEICSLHAGGDVPKEHFSKEKTAEYSIPVLSNGIGENALYGYTDIAKITSRCITIAARGTIGYCELRKSPFFPIIRLICAVPKQGILADYLKYVTETITFKVPTSGIPQLTVPMLKTYKVPVPPLEEQKRIVAILDRFDVLCNDLTSGLPAEIEARKKQYEYYRDKLLTFKERT